MKLDLDGGARNTIEVIILALHPKSKMPGNLIKSQEVKFIPITDLINLARNVPDQGRAKHIILHMLIFFKTGGEL